MWVRLGTVRRVIGGWGSAITSTSEAQGARGHDGGEAVSIKHQLDPNLTPAHRVSFAHIMPQLIQKMNHGDQPLYPSR